ncbi:MAG TPA: nucleotide sugar dehydrogenase [Acidimicrobiia bacterium]|jgi:GDP-mannose 6-dehydrogenase|nr:nucleotide sugar dehydrogenase [Acidimicrobiia bacterium]
MNLAVFGLGYVGSVTAACLAEDGHQVLGVDSNRKKVVILNSGRGPIREPGLDDLISSGIASGRLEATVDSLAAVEQSDAALICVGTPSRPDGSIELDHVRNVVAEIGRALRGRATPYTVILRSTVLPGTTRDVVLPILESTSGLTVGEHLDLCFNPEFLREGSSLKDYREPPKIVVGTEDGKPNAILDQLYAQLDCPRFDTVFEIAELAKYVDNTWHALKVSFANEMGRLARDLGVDGRDVMSIMTGDTKLNISPRYLRPGFAYGGSCLPKDVSALRAHAKSRDLDVPLISAIPESNDEHIRSAVDLITDIGDSRVGLLGVTFKSNTDDLRNSPFLELARRLLDQGVDVRVFDPDIDPNTLIGANMTFLSEQLPTLERILVSSPDEVMQFGDTIVLGKDDEPLVTAALTLGPAQHLVDLAGMSVRPLEGSYVGIAW